MAHGPERCVNSAALQMNNNDRGYLVEDRGPIVRHRR